MRKQYETPLVETTASVIESTNTHGLKGSVDPPFKLVAGSVGFGL
jgi:hypothetical protein